MTVHGFSKVFEPDEIVILAKLSGKRIAIDGPISVNAAAMANVTLTNKFGETTQHITTCLANMLNCLKNDITAIWVWDSKEKNPDKKETNEERQRIREKHLAEIKYEENEIDEMESAIKNLTKKQIAELSPNYIEKLEQRKSILEIKKKRNPESSDISRYFSDIKFIIDCLGIQTITMPKGVEAEQGCAYLNKINIADGTLSTDPDSLLYGGKVLYKKIPGQSGKYHKYTLSSCLKQHDLTMKQFIQVGITLGTDFAPKVKGIAAGTVIKKLKDDYIDFTDEQNDALNLFQKKLTFEPEIKQTKRTTKSLNKLKEWLVNEQGFSAENVEKKLAFLYES